MVKPLANHNKELETQISLLAQTHLGPFPEKHVDVVATSSEKQIEIPKESNDEVEVSSGEKSPPAPPEREVVEVEKEAFYVVPTPYNPPILFP